MGGRHIIPIQPANGHGEVVVVEVQQEGSHPLDVRLVGCEGENPYVTTIKHRNIGKLKSKFKGTDEEWETVVAHFLLQKQPESGAAGILDDVRMVYSLKGEKLEISIRKDVKGIKVTLGEILLPRDEEFEFNPFEWAQASAQAHTRSLREFAELKARVNREHETIAKLNAQLEDFIKTKNETETAMLQQFMGLLNEKKRKIRDQSRLLAVAKVDKATASAVQSVREETKPRNAGASRVSKRKASVKVEPEPGSDNDQMEIEEAKVEEQEDAESGPITATPEQSSDNETEDEGDGASDSIPALSAPQPRVESSQTVRLGSAVAESSKNTPSQEGVPPRRELPFGRPATRRQPAQKQPSPAATDDDETEDEEL